MGAVSPTGQDCSCWLMAGPLCLAKVCQGEDELRAGIWRCGVPKRGCFGSLVLQHGSEQKHFRSTSAQNTEGLCDAENQPGWMWGGLGPGEDGAEPAVRPHPPCSWSLGRKGGGAWRREEGRAGPGSRLLLSARPEVVTHNSSSVRSWPRHWLFPSMTSLYQGHKGDSSLQFQGTPRLGEVDGLLPTPSPPYPSPPQVTPSSQN